MSQPKFGCGRPGAKEKCNDSPVAKCPDIIVCSGGNPSLQPRIGINAEVQGLRFVFGPTLKRGHSCDRVCLTDAPFNEVATKSIQCLAISQPGGRAWRTSGFYIGEEGFDMAGVEGGYRHAVDYEMPQEPVEHGRMLHARARGERPSIGAHCVSFLPVPVRLGR